MLSEQSLPAVMGYFAGLLHNPNNVTNEAAPVTVAKELEFGDDICSMLGYSTDSWAHICSGGSVANYEAMWTARIIQFMPLVFKDICDRYDLPYKIVRDGFSDIVSIQELTSKELLALNPSISITMYKDILKLWLDKKNRKGSSSNEIKEFQRLINDNLYNVRSQGYHNVINLINANDGISLCPVILVSESAHYCWKKAADLLGYGENAIRSIAITSQFRMDTEDLKSKINNLSSNEYIAAVVGVVGTTEEGAIDPIHEIAELRRESERVAGVSFWLHVDAAWGGYFTTVLASEYTNAIRNDYNNSENDENKKELVSKYISILAEDAHLSEKYSHSFDVYAKDISYCAEVRDSIVEWKDLNVFSSLFAMNAADSITVDPHKMGYVPYPAGVIAYKDIETIRYLKRMAAYIFTEDWHVEDESNSELKKQVGSFILEGSKPGAVALSCWLAAKSIPLDLHSHGKIVTTTALNAAKFADYLLFHKDKYFIAQDKILERMKIPQPLLSSKYTFSFDLLYSNIDTNVVCFYVRPRMWNIYDKNANCFKTGEVLEWSIDEINALNSEICESFSISADSVDYLKRANAQRFYFTTTTLNQTQYNATSLNHILEKNHYSAEDYNKFGMTVIRCTLMNPWYYSMSTLDNKIDYFQQAILELHRVSGIEIRKKLDCDIEIKKCISSGGFEDFNKLISNLKMRGLTAEKLIQRGYYYDQAKRLLLRGDYNVSMSEHDPEWLSEMLDSLIDRQE
jgi:glutamate/tyrosine decarboxylase-like PLP-dependent enzyme